LNGNFRKIEHFEAKLIKAANEINTKIGSLGQAERATQALEMSMHLTQSMAQQVEGYKNKLERLSENIKTPTEITIVQNLLRNQRYCSNLVCYSDTNFLFSDYVLTSSFLAKPISLRKKTFFSCTLSNHNLTSIYHNALGQIKDDIFFPDNKHLPSINTENLYKNINNPLT
jgi:hypothetical protein